MNPKLTIPKSLQGPVYIPFNRKKPLLIRHYVKRLDLGAIRQVKNTQLLKELILERVDLLKDKAHKLLALEILEFDKDEGSIENKLLDFKQSLVADFTDKEVFEDKTFQSLRKTFI